MEGRQDDKASSYEFSRIHKSLEQLPAVQPYRMHSTFVTNFLGSTLQASIVRGSKSLSSLTCNRRFFPFSIVTEYEMCKSESLERLFIQTVAADENCRFLPFRFQRTLNYYSLEESFS